MTSLRRLLPALLPALAAGCFGSQPPLERYRLTPVEGPRPGQAQGQHATVTVEPYSTPGLYGDPQIVFRIGESQYGAYPNREWALPLSTMLARLTAEAIRGSGRQVRVLEAETGSPDGLAWRGTVREFEEVNRGEKVSVAVHLDGSLVRLADDSLLWQGSARSERPVAGDSMPQVIEALSAAAMQALDTLIGQAWPLHRSAAVR